MSRHLSEFEERRLDQLAFAADEAEDQYYKKRSHASSEERQRLSQDMELHKRHLTQFVSGMVQK